MLTHSVTSVLFFFDEAFQEGDMKLGLPLADVWAGGEQGGAGLGVGHRKHKAECPDPLSILLSASFHSPTPSPTHHNLWISNSLI